MRFSAAIEMCIYGGHKIYRAGWNGKGQYVRLGECIDFNEGDKRRHTGTRALIFHGTRGIQVGWLASQGDMLAEDWEVME